MKSIIRILLFTILSLLYTISYGQSVSSQALKWNVDSFVNVDNKEFVNHTCEFESTSKHIKFIQKGGAHIYEFVITGQDGNWPDVKKDGVITYLVTFRGNSGTIKFQRIGTTVTIQPDINVSGKNTLPFTFNVTTITEL